MSELIAAGYISNCIYTFSTCLHLIVYFNKMTIQLKIKLTDSIDIWSSSDAN